MRAARAMRSVNVEPDHNAYMQMLSARVALLRLPTGRRVGAAPLSFRYPARCAAAAPDRLPPPDVQKLAKLAHIAVTEEEVCAVMC